MTAAQFRRRTTKTLELYAVKRERDCLGDETDENLKFVVIFFLVLETGLGDHIWPKPWAYVISGRQQNLYKI